MVKENTMQQTEIGLIPEDWEVVSLSDCSKRITDGEHLTPKRTKTGYFLLSARNILNGKIDLSDVDYVGFEEYQRIRARCNPEFGDVLISCSGSIGRVATVPKDFQCVMVRSAALVKPDFSIASGHYVQFFLQSSVGQNQIFTSMNQGAQPNLFLNHINGIRIAFPPLPEQQVIAEALSDADAWIESLEDLIAKKRLIKQGAMQELLTPKEGWEVKKLGELVSDGGLIRGPFGGALKKEYFVKSGFKVYEQKNAIYKSAILGNYYIDNEKFKELSRFEIKENDFILSCSGTIGRMYRIPKKFQKGIINQALLIIRLNSSIMDLDYFNHIFQYDTIQAKIIDDTQGGAMKNLVGMSEFRNTEIPSPSFTEQTRIATILSDMDTEIEQLEQKLTKARHIKQGMMQELLTGRVRLV